MEDFEEPTFNIYCVWDDESGGEQDGYPRYAEVGFDDLDDLIKDLIQEYLDNKLKGSYTWSPVYIEDEGVSKPEYDKYEFKDECELTRLKILVDPVSGTEDDYKVIVRGDGKIIKDTFGLEGSLV